jgi:hypothetical protein
VALEVTVTESVQVLLDEDRSILSYQPYGALARTGKAPKRDATCVVVEVRP